MEAIGQSLVNLMGHGATWMARLFLAVLVLCLGWVISKIVSKVLRQVLITADFDRRLGRWLDVESMSEGQEKPKRQIAAVIEAVAYWFLIVIFVIFALEVLGDKTLSVVLQNVLSEMGLAVPHILKALLILAAAWLLAFMAKFAAIKFLRRAAETKSLGWLFTPTEGKPAGDMAVSLGNFLFYFVLLLALLPFLDALALPALVDPLKAMMTKFLAYVPNLVTAGGVLVLGYFVARL